VAVFLQLTFSCTPSRIDGRQVYAIEVSTKRYVWTVFRRYNDFIELQDVVRPDELRVCCRRYALTPLPRTRFRCLTTRQLKEKFKYKGTLPPKKAFGNMSPAFIEARRAGLEQYLKTLVMTADDKVLQSPAMDRFLEIRDHMSKVLLRRQRIYAQRR